MNDKTGSNRVLRCAGALVTMVAVAMLAAGCGVVHVHFGSGSAGSVTFQPNSAFVQCMRSHGLTRYPDSTRRVTMQLTGDSHLVQAYDACKHLLASGG